MLEIRACFPTNEAFAAIWWRWVLVEQDGDRAIVSLQKTRLIDRHRARFALERDPDACLDRLAVLLPPGTKVASGLNEPLALLTWGRAESADALRRRLLMEMQVVKTLRERCFQGQDAMGTVLLAWGASSVRILDIRNGHSAADNACSRRFELAYPIDVAGHAMTPQHDLPLTAMKFEQAAYSIEETRAAWGVRD